jgi:hypothetical protein
VNNKFVQSSKRKANSATPSPANSGHMNTNGTNGNNGSGHKVDSSSARISVSVNSGKV